MVRDPSNSEKKSQANKGKQIISLFKIRYAD